MNAVNFTVLKSSDMIFLAERMFELQEQYRKHGKNVHVDIGYHYTKSSNLSRIRTDGLLTKADRRAASIHSHSNGGTFGDGVYLGNNPFSYHAFAGSDIGIFVARLRGQTSRFEERTPGDTTLLGRGSNSDEVCVLQSSSQSLSMVHFPSDLVDLRDDDNPGNYMVHTYHCGLQAIVDDFFNQSQRTEVPYVLPSSVQCRYNIPQMSRKTVLTYEAPDRLHQPQDCYESVDGCGAQCPICLDLVSSDSVKLLDCCHTFHEKCILVCLEVSTKCPVCRRPLSLIQGSSPSGTMESHVDNTTRCLGHGPGAIVINYNMKAGIQKSYHNAPGISHPATQRTAYIPNSPEGHDLLKRLQFAFCAGLTFTIGTSFTSGLDNVITWASIHHKTTVYCGTHGYPDLSYFHNVNEELDALHVPAADDL